MSSQPPIIFRSFMACGFECLVLPIIKYTILSAIELLILLLLDICLELGKSPIVIIGLLFLVITVYLLVEELFDSLMRVSILLVVHVDWPLGGKVLVVWVVDYSIVTGVLLMTLLGALWALVDTDVIQWNGFFHHSAIHILLQHLQARNIRHKLGFHLNLQRVVNLQLSKHLFHLLILKIVIPVFGSLKTQNLLNRMVFPLCLLVVWSALAWVSCLYERGHHRKYLPQFDIVLHCKYITKIIQKHHILNMLLWRPMSCLKLTANRVSTVNRHQFQNFLTTINTPQSEHLRMFLLYPPGVILLLIVHLYHRLSWDLFDYLFCIRLIWKLSF